MNCVEVNQHLEAMLDNALDPEMEKAVRLHVKTCASCEDSLNQMQTLRTVLQESRLPAPSASLDERVMRAFNQAHMPRRESSVWWRRLVFGSINIPRPVFAAALVVFALALGLATYIGRLTATQISVASLPTAPERVVISPAPQIVYVPVKAEPDVQRIRQMKTTKRSPVARKTQNTPRRTEAQPLESFTLVSATGANYTTNARLKGFEPLPSATVRIIKGKGE